MIKETIDTINSLLSLDVNHLGLVERVHKFAEPVRIYPAKYVGKGEYEPVNLDFYEGVSYHRINGVQNSVESESRTGCGVDLRVTQPMRMVVYCNKGILGSDDENSVIKIATNLRAEMIFSNDATLALLLKSDYVSVVVNSVNFDTVDVWNDEFQNVDYKLSSSKCFIAIDYTIELNADKDCYLYECN